MIYVLIVALVAMLGVFITIGPMGVLTLVCSFILMIAQAILVVVDFCQSLMGKLTGASTPEGEPDIFFDMVMRSPEVWKALLAIFCIVCGSCVWFCNGTDH